MGTYKNILVVDDEPGIRHLLNEVLSGEGFNVVMASDGQESVECLKGSSFDLVITDLNMPRLDGIGLLRWMKKSGRREKIIVMSGEASDRSLAGADIPPVTLRLHKPIRIPLFVDTVSAAMA